MNTRDMEAEFSAMRARLEMLCDRVVHRAEADAIAIEQSRAALANERARVFELDMRLRSKQQGGDAEACAAEADLWRYLFEKATATEPARMTFSEFSADVQRYAAELAKRSDLDVKHAVVIMRPIL